MKNEYEIRGEHVAIFIKRHNYVHETLVDYDDFKKLQEIDCTWLLIKTGTHSYVFRCTNKKGKKKNIPLHRFIMGCVDTGRAIQVDHINHNTLDNRKTNLRVCSEKDNLKNKKTTKGISSSDYKGVSLDKNSGKWRVRIGIDKKVVNIGWYDNEKEAALAYNKAASFYFGEFAYLNEVN
jgi:hypothetical protein